MTRARDGGPVRSLRLVFSYDAGSIDLVSVTPRRSWPRMGVDVRVEPHAAAVTLELRRADGTVLHRQSLHEPIPESTEAFQDGSPYRVTTRTPRGVFTTVVPSPDDDVEIVIEAGLCSRPIRPTPSAR